MTYYFPESFPYKYTMLFKTSLLTIEYCMYSLSSLGLLVNLLMGFTPIIILYYNSMRPNSKGNSKQTIIGRSLDKIKSIKEKPTLLKP